MEEQAEGDAVNSLFALARPNVFPSITCLLWWGFGMSSSLRDGSVGSGGLGQHGQNSQQHHMDWETPPMPLSHSPWCEDIPTGFLHGKASPSLFSSILQANKPGMTFEQILRGDVSSHVLENLQEDREYSISIYAVYPEGPSQPVAALGRTRKSCDPVVGPFCPQVLCPHLGVGVLMHQDLPNSILTLPSWPWTPSNTTLQPGEGWEIIFPPVLHPRCTRLVLRDVWSWTVTGWAVLPLVHEMPSAPGRELLEIPLTESLRLEKPSRIPKSNHCQPCHVPKCHMHTAF